MRRRGARLICVVVVAAFQLLQPNPAKSAQGVRRVLIVNDLGIISSPGFAEIVQAIVTGLQKSPYRIELYNESLDLNLFPDRASRNSFREGIIQKYSARKPDVIIAAGPVSLKFIAKLYDKFQAPTIFCTIWGGIPDEVGHGMPFTGVLAQLDAEGTLKVALHLLPSTKHVVVVGGMGKFDEGFEAIAKQSFHNYESKLEFTYLFDLTMPALLERLKHLPNDTIVYHTSISQDAAGDRFIDSAQSVPMVASAANAPVFVMDDVDLRAGTVGGDLVNWTNDGRIAAEMALKVLNGEKPQDILIAKSTNAYMFDWHALKRWGLKESNLPPGSIVLNRQPTVWESYKAYVIGGIALFLAEAILIFALLWQRARANKAEAELVISFERHRMAVEAGRSVGWDYELKSGQNRWFGDLQNVLGIPSADYSAQIGEFSSRLHPDDRDRVSKLIADAQQGRRPYIAEFRFQRTDGEVRWVNARGKFHYAADGTAQRMVGLAADITDRKLAEQKLSESEDRLAGIVESAMDAIIVLDEDRRIVLFNAAAEKMFGCTHDEAVGTVIDHFIPERFGQEHEAYMRRFGESGITTPNMGTPVALWAVRANGQEFPAETSIAHLKSDGRKLFTIIIRDVTERKLAEEALATIGRRLIEAHEEERTWLARELHDDINQRLALVAVELDRWKQHPPSAEQLTEQISHTKERIDQIARDVQGLSHRLHSSKLEYLGLSTAASSFCKELSEQNKVEVQFKHAGIPRNLPKEVSLCLFRVLQEALQNARKHSGVRSFAVDLHGTEDVIDLTVSDVGRGFEEQEAFTRHGLGLISMRERLQLVHGELSVKSKPGAGTTIRARVRLKAAEYRAMVG